jgi:hypothetical protein
LDVLPFLDVVATGLEAITASSARLAGTAGAASSSSVAALRVERAHRRREMFARGVCAMNAGAREGGDEARRHDGARAAE